MQEVLHENNGRESFGQAIALLDNLIPSSSLTPKGQRKYSGGEKEAEIENLEPKLWSSTNLGLTLVLSDF